MRLPWTRTSIPHLIITVFVLGMMLAFVMDIRERARRKAALPAAEAAYQQARKTRRLAEWEAARVRRRRSAESEVFPVDLDDGGFKAAVERAWADERAKKAEYDRLRAIRTGRFW
jgi:hypothetical protein